VTHLRKMMLEELQRRNYAADRRLTSTADFACSKSGSPSLVFQRFDLPRLVFFLMKATPLRLSMRVHWLGGVSTRLKMSGNPDGS
jgi:hypothetical protein